MKRKPVFTSGALHPVLFFIVVYIIALFFSIFICSSLFYSCNTGAGSNLKIEIQKSTVPGEKNSALAIHR